MTFQLIVPDYDPLDPQPYAGDIRPGTYTLNETVALLRQHKDDPEAIQFIADMMEE